MCYRHTAEVVWRHEPQQGPDKWLTHVSCASLRFLRSPLYCLHDGFTPASVPPELEMKQAFYFLCTTKPAVQAAALKQSSLQREFRPKCVSTGHSWLFSGHVLLPLSRDFDGKHLKVRTPSLVTHLTRASVSHRVITERQKRSTVSHKQETGVIHSFHIHRLLAHPPFSPTEGSPQQSISVF